MLMIETIFLIAYARITQAAVISQSHFCGNGYTCVKKREKREKNRREERVEKVLLGTTLLRTDGKYNRVNIGVNKTINKYLSLFCFIKRFYSVITLNVL